jgi:hypothetical protein
MGISPDVGRHSMQAFCGGHFARLNRNARGYLGWLLTNCQFLDEHDALIKSHTTVIRRWGLRLAGKDLPSNLFPDVANPTNDTAWNLFDNRCREFLLRWRITELAGPYLPSAMQILTAGFIPQLQLNRLNESGGLLFIPDISPIPSRDELREILEDSLHPREPPDHLSEWFEIIRAKNPAKNRLGRFSRVFELQHYCRIMQDRHGAALVGNLGRWEVAMASYLEVSDETIHQDMILIRSRLGGHWMIRKSPLE